MRKKFLAVILIVVISCQLTINSYASELEKSFSDIEMESTAEDIIENEFTDGEVHFDAEENENIEEMISDGEETPDVEDTNQDVYSADSNYLTYEDYTYTVWNNEVTIVGYKGDMDSLVIPQYIDEKKVSVIGDRAFENCKFLNELILPEGIKSIGRRAFRNCKSLEKLILPEGLEYIGSECIAGTGISKIEIPSSVTKCEGPLGRESDGALGGALNLEEVVFAEGMKRIPGYICYNHKNNSTLKKVVIPDSVTEIGRYAFYDCGGITEINFKEKIREINDYAFENCTGLESITFNGDKKLIETASGIKMYSVYIRTSAFENCTKLKNVQLKNVEYIEDRVFRNCKSLEKLILPEGLEYIGSECIAGTGISKIEIPSSVTKCEGPLGRESDGALGGALNLEEVVFAEGMKRIPGYICYNHKNNSTLKKVVIPDSVTEIERYVFYNGTAVIIYGYSGTYAEVYAENEQLPFVALKNPSDISQAKIFDVQKVYEYTGKSIKPVPKVTLNNKQLVKNKDYKITYKNNKNVGTATIIITGKGKYSGSKKIEFEIAVLKKDIEKSAVSFANIFAEKAKSSEDITIPNAKEQLENLGNQLTITGYSGEVPDEVLEAFATAVLNTIKDSNIDKYETNQNKLANQIYKQIKGGLKSGSKQITLKNGSKYTVNYNIFAQSFGGVGAQVSWADVKWKDTANRSYTVHITANSKNENMKKALASYCAVLAQLNNDIWKDFLTKYVTDGWKLAGLNSIKELDDKTVSKFFDRSERLILVICGDQKAKKEFANDAGKTLKEKLLKMSKTQFQDLIKKNVPDGDKLVKAAGQYKKVIDKYNDYEKKFNKWNKTKKDSDLTKCENAYQKCQDLLDVLNDSLNMVS